MKRLFVAVIIAMTPAASANSSDLAPRSCTESGGEEFGRSGEAYRGGCLPEAERAFLSGYLVGRRVFSAEVYKQRAEREYLEASRHTRTAIDYHAEKASAALAAINDSQAGETMQARARNDLEMHREQILHIEEEFDWANDRSWDAYLHLEQINEELDEWRKSDARAFVLDLFTEAQRFARNESAVGFCSDEPDTAFFSLAHSVKFKMAVFW